MSVEQISDGTLAGRWRPLAPALRARLRAVVLIVGGLLVLFAGHLTVFLVAHGVFERSMESAAMLLPAATPVVTLGYLLLLRRKGALAPPPRRVSHGRAIAAIALGMVALLGGLVALSWLNAALGLEPHEQPLVVDAVHRVPVLPLVITFGFLGPLGEELFFRRFVLTTAGRAFGRTATQIGTALLFAALHGNIAAITIYLYVGLLLGLAYAHTGRLYVSTTIHSLNNLLVIAALSMGAPP